MAPLRKITIEHFTHPGHPLTYISSTNTQFLCDGCNKMGNGNRYRCGTCDFDLHEYCCTCPASLASFMHPAHPLVLVVRKAQGTRNVERVCDVCGTCVNGIFYRCKACEFDAHPLCTRLPQHARHPLHSHHALRLQPLPSGPTSCGRCAVCKTTSPNAWGYRCGVCDFGIHLKCFNSVPAGPVCVKSNSGSNSGSGLSLTLKSSSVSSFSRGFYKSNQNLSSGGDENEVYAMIAQWASSTWLSG